MNLLTRRRDDNGGGDREMIGHTIGNALVVHPRNVLRAEVRDLALTLAADPDHELVVVDLPASSSFSVWESAAKLMPRKRRGLRLVIGGRSRDTIVLAGQWLSERLGRTVIAPDGVVVPGVGGSLFVDSGWGTGWVRFQPGKPPKLDGKRFPRPRWENASSLVEVMPTSAVGVTEPLPGGVWLRPRGPESVLHEHRRRLIETLPCQPDVCTVVIGCPGAPPITLYDVARFWSWLPEEVRGRLRLVKFGPVTLPGSGSFGQQVADALGEKVTCYTGLPVGSRTEPDIVTVQSDGRLGWRAFVQELSFSPSEPHQPASPPVLVSYREPVFGLEEIEPAVFRYTHDLVLEAVQAGLWLRPPHEVGHADAVRSTEPDGAQLLVLFEEGSSPARAREVAQDVQGRLDSHARRLGSLVPASAVARQRIAGGARAVVEAEPVRPVGITRPVPGSVLPHEPAVGAGVADAVLSLDSATTRVESGPAPPHTSETLAPSALADVVPVTDFPPIADLPGADAPEIASFSMESLPVVEPPVSGAPSITSAPAPRVRREVPPDPAPSPPLEPSAAPRNAASVTDVQPTPAPAAAALLPKRGLDEERAWLRRTLSQEYAAVANSVSRVLSEHPGFQGALDRTSDSVLTDAVAIRLYLSSQGDGVDMPLRTGTVGPHVPFARCVVSGLGRLPSHRGAAVFSVSMTPQEWEIYRSRKLVTEWSFVNALSAPCARQFEQNDVDVLIWSMTARRTAVLEPDVDPTADRVLFVPGTNFKVLDVSEPADGKRGQLLLRELAFGEIDSSGRVDRNRASLDELAVNSLRRVMQTWESAKKQTRIPETSLPRFAQLPGLVRTTAQEEAR